LLDPNLNFKVVSAVLREDADQVFEGRNVTFARTLTATARRDIPRLLLQMDLVLIDGDNICIPLLADTPPVPNITGVLVERSSAEVTSLLK
jgi:hypothetical protein